VVYLGPKFTIFLPLNDITASQKKEKRRQKNTPSQNGISLNAHNSKTVKATDSKFYLQLETDKNFMPTKFHDRITYGARVTPS